MPTDYKSPLENHWAQTVSCIWHCSTINLHKECLQTHTHKQTASACPSWPQNSISLLSLLRGKVDPSQGPWVSGRRVVLVPSIYHPQRQLFAPTHQISCDFSLFIAHLLCSVYVVNCKPLLITTIKHQPKVVVVQCTTEGGQCSGIILVT